jgi:TolB-like protein/tRNA A-37 threonylcarbamoyl transferase component Bud32/Tfp pilus assembly protein PilF
MTAEPLRLDALLESVADGTAVDWDAAEAAADARQRRIVRNLRLVARIAEVHRTLPEGTGEGTLALPHGDADGSYAHWGRLLLLERIGEGTFGEVYRARDPWLDREVALKLLKPGMTGRGRLLAEAQALARLRHPNVVTVHGADMHDRRIGLWMELVRGRTLAAIVGSDGPLSAAEAAVIGQELCRAVGAVHAAGLVHRDIKAQNVMREAGGRLVLMDFGAGHTPLYSAPELLNGREATVATDIYALGVLLYYLVAARFPVRGSTSQELTEAHARNERRHIAETRPDLPSYFVSAVERALNPDPAKRFASAWAMSDALQPRARSRRAGLMATAAAAALLAGAVASYWTGGSEPAISAAAVRRVAVMPLQAFGGADPYLAAGITEALTQELSMSGPLTVVSRTSVERAVAGRTGLSQLAQTLNADAIVEGAVSRSQERVSVNVRLVHAGTHSTLWARTFERPATELSMLQGDIVRAIADGLRTLGAPVAARPESERQINPAAYEAYMRGRYEYRRGSQPGMEQAVSHFQRAIAIEPGYGRAYASLAQSMVWLAHFGVFPREQAARRARDAAVRALELDAGLPDAHAALGRIEFQEWNFASAEARLRRAVGLDPSFVEPRIEFALFLAGRGRFEEAFAHLATARSVDPLSPDVADRTAAVYYYARRYTEALAEVERAIRLDPDNVGSRLGYVRILNALGRHADALTEAQRTSAEAAGHPWFEAEMAQAESALGRAENARARIASLISAGGGPRPRVTAHTLAVAYARLDSAEAFRWLEREFDARSYSVLWIKVDPRLDPLRSDPRFPGLLARLQLAP